MKLQRMRKLEDGRFKKTICALGILQGGEFTLCGDDAVCPVREGEYKGTLVMEPVGEVFEGKLKDVTCELCLMVIDFVKGLN